MSKFILPNINKCKVFRNGRFETLNEDTYRGVQEFCKEVYKANNVRFVFRADRNVAHTYNSNYDSPELARRIFMVGVKGNSFFSSYDHHNIDMFRHGEEIFERINETLNCKQGTKNFGIICGVLLLRMRILLNSFVTMRINTCMLTLLRRDLNCL